ncbi:MAG: sulfatase-like hydrolase/transferase, partial [Candidatus Atribacteria bacterium]|nr:sulfatase-like hydrolase/transferase [Candidatus Atribacteria bacterium]
MKEQNIIIISLDEVRPDHLSCYGYQKISTPAIDQIASEGVRFANCFS